MRFLRFHGSSTKIHLPTAETVMTAEDALEALADGEELSGCVVSGLDLTDPDLDVDQLSLRNCVLENANLANTVVDKVRLERVVFADSMLVGFRPQTMTMRGCLFDTCRLDLAILSDLRVIEPSAFVSCSMREVDLSRAEAPGCIVHSCDLTGANLTAAHLDATDLRDSNLTDVQGLTTVRNVQLSPTQLTDLLVALQRENRLTIDDAESGPTSPWQEAPGD